MTKKCQPECKQVGQRASKYWLSAKEKRWVSASVCVAVVEA